jgi:hypothetical protein
MMHHQENVQLDLRESLVNEGAVGKIEAVSIGKESIGVIRGILFDLDRKFMKENPYWGKLSDDPKADFETCILPMLKREPVLEKSEVRFTGNGYHVLIWLAPQVELETPGDRKRWEGLIKTIQCLLPIDPNQPGITAMTRPIGSINGKNQKAVERLKSGDGVTEEELFS